MIVIKYATAADAENIALLSRQTFYDTFVDFNTKEDMNKFMNGTFSMDTLVKETTLPEHIFLTAFMEDQLMGYAKLTESENPPELGNADAIEIGRIYVDKKAIGLGVGKLLMEKCIAIGKKKTNKLFGSVCGNTMKRLKHSIQNLVLRSLASMILCWEMMCRRIG